MLPASVRPAFYFVLNPRARLTNSLTESPDFLATCSSFRCSAGVIRNAIRWLWRSLANFFGLPIRVMSYCITISTSLVNGKSRESQEKTPSLPLWKSLTGEECLGLRMPVCHTPRELQ